MAKTKREYILATCFLYGIGSILAFISLGTERWVEGEAKWINADAGASASIIKYGLFSGVYQQKYGVYATYEVTMTCLVNENVCALLCGTDNSRYNQLKKLYKNEEVSFDSNCPTISNVRDIEYGLHSRTFLRLFTADMDTDEKVFLNCGLWVSTILFLSVSAILGLFLTCLAIWNTASNPIEAYFNIWGMYIYNAIAILSSLLVCALWAGMHLKYTLHNIGIFYTLKGQMDSDGRSHLGYSYWLNLGVLFCYICAIAVLYIRNYLISKEPRTKINIDETSDPAIYLY